MRIGSLQVGPGEPCALIAEIGNAHDGDFARAIRLLNAAKEAGASAAKLQTYTPAELVGLRGDGPAPEPWGSQGWTMETLYQKARTPLAWIPVLFDHAYQIGLPLFSSVFGAESLAVLEAAACPVYKIAKFERQAEPLQLAVAATGKPMIVSVPKRYDNAIIAADVERLYCPGSYPCAVEDVHLPWNFREAGYLGLSSHCLDPLLPVAAVARGCSLIEMHFQLAEEPSELESNVSLTQYAFAQMIQDVRQVERMLA